MRITKKCSILAFLLIFVWMKGYSAWLEIVPSIITQNDGSRIDVFRSGDEFHNHDSSHNALENVSSIEMIQVIEIKTWRIYV
ncbi:MAG: hypothetical protein FWG98_14010 [Candidatus Cloacimonetes bacterium]|nr:hypothetical protein [Candidatus Cloacimonadota bacterium]